MDPEDFLFIMNQFNDDDDETKPALREHMMILAVPDGRNDGQRGSAPGREVGGAPKSNV